MSDLPTDRIRGCIECEKTYGAEVWAGEAEAQLQALLAENERLQADSDEWKVIADDFAAAHRKCYGLDGAWDKENLAYERAVKKGVNEPITSEPLSMEKLRWMVTGTLAEHHITLEEFLEADIDDFEDWELRDLYLMTHNVLKGDTNMTELPTDAIRHCIDEMATTPHRHPPIMGAARKELRALLYQNVVASREITLLTQQVSRLLHSRDNDRGRLDYLLAESDLRELAIEQAHRLINQGDKQ